MAMRNDGAVLTMSGRAATNPTISGAKGERVSFRAVSTERRYDEASGDWIDGDEFGVTVVCWRSLGTSVLQLVRKGDPVVVDGKISTRKFERNGVIDYFTEVKADHVAFDVARAAGRIKRQDSAPDLSTVKPLAEAGEQAATEDGQDAGDPFQAMMEPDHQPALAEVG
jgi:single-strand DNA-binding protein